MNRMRISLKDVQLKDDKRTLPPLSLKPHERELLEKVMRKQDEREAKRHAGVME